MKTKLVQPTSEGADTVARYHVAVNQFYTARDVVNRMVNQILKFDVNGLIMPATINRLAKAVRAAARHRRELHRLRKLCPRHKVAD